MINFQRLLNTNLTLEEIKMVQGTVEGWQIYTHHKMAFPIDL